MTSPAHPTPTATIQHSDPITGQTCPACGRADTIVREMVHHQHTAQDVLIETLAGIPIWLQLILPRRTIRMRCVNCRCCFRAQVPSWSKTIFRILLIATFVALAAWTTYYRATILPPIGSWIRATWKSDPIWLVMGIATVTTVIVLAIIIGAYPKPRRLGAPHAGSPTDP